ncbi:MAG: hypothetical protein WCN27_01395, partial [Alphaproteobacteria bacterium]
ITVLTIALFFSASGVFGSAGAPPSAAASSSSSAIDESSGAKCNAYGLTQDQQSIYTGAMRDYMLGLNQTCRYGKPEEMSLSLPGAFFELAPMPSLPSYKAVVFIKAGSSFSRALDSLLTLPAADRHIIDCTLASDFTRLQGVRAVLGDDIMFDKVCNMLSGSQTGEFNERTEITKIITKSFYMSNFFTDGGKFVTGALCYLKQLDDHSCFRFDGKGHFKNIAALARAVERETVYSVKHRESSMQGLNVLLIDGESCVFFEEGQGLTALTDAAKLVVDGLNEDLNAQESKGMSPASVVEAFNSIKYRNRDTAVAQILAEAIYKTPNFTKVFACAITIKARDEAKTKVTAFLKALQAKGGTDWLKIHGALKGMPLIAQSHFLEGIDPASSTDTILSAITEKSKEKKSKM